MKKLYFLLFALLITAGILVGCGGTNEEKKENNGEATGQQTETAFPVTITDATGEKITIEKEPQRIVSIMPSNTEVAFALGVGDKIIGVIEWDNYPEEVADIEKVGDMDINIEKIISLNPDLVLGHASHAKNSAEGLQQLKDAGITVVLINEATSFQQAYDSIEMIGKVTGTDEKAAEIINDMKDRIQKVKEKTANVEERKSVVFEISGQPLFLAGKNTFMDEILSIINAENVVNDLDDPWPQVDEEYIIEKNPDVIITTYGYYTEDPVGQVTGRPGWQDITAVKEKQVYDVHSDKVTRPGPRLAEGVEEVAKIIYPELFE